MRHEPSRLERDTQEDHAERPDHDVGKGTASKRCSVATTILAGRLGPTEKYALVVVREANGGANV